MLDHLQKLLDFYIIQLSKELQDLLDMQPWTVSIQGIQITSKKR